jgi:hypothetical protein
VKRSRESRYQLFANAAASAILVVLREAYAATVRIDKVDLLGVVRHRHHIRVDEIKPVCLVSTARKQLVDLDLQADPLDLLTRLAPEIGFGAQTSEPQEIDLADHPAAQTALSRVTAELLDEDARPK